MLHAPVCGLQDRSRRDGRGRNAGGAACYQLPMHTGKRQGDRRTPQRSRRRVRSAPLQQKLWDWRALRHVNRGLRVLMSARYVIKRPSTVVFVLTGKTQQVEASGKGGRGASANLVHLWMWTGGATDVTCRDSKVRYYRTGLTGPEGTGLPAPAATGSIFQGQVAANPSVPSVHFAARLPQKSRPTRFNSKNADSIAPGAGNSDPAHHWIILFSSSEPA